MVPLVAAAIAATGLGVGLLPRRLQALAAALVLAGVLVTTRPFDPKAAMVLEAQWDRPNSRARQQVTACLPRDTPRPTIMASMGSLAHYMQELSSAGFGIRDFLHEGNGDIWLAALNGPARYVGWMLIEERAEGGDMLFQRAAEDPRIPGRDSNACVPAAGSRSTGTATPDRTPARARDPAWRTSEANLEHRLVSEPAEIEPVADEADIGSAAWRLPTGIAPPRRSGSCRPPGRAPRPSTSATRFVAVRRIPRVEDLAGAGVDERSHLAVLPVDQRDPDADVGLDGCAAASRDEPHGRGDGHQPQLELLLDFGTVRHW